MPRGQRPASRGGSAEQLPHPLRPAPQPRPGARRRRLGGTDAGPRRPAAPQRRLMRIAYQGLPGAFGHQAALAFAPGYEPVAEPSFAAVVEAVVQGRAERGILPVENNEAGPVAEAQAMLVNAPVEI